MALAAETAAWLEDLKKEGSLDEAAFNALKATFENEKVNNFVKGSVLRQADYSRQSAEIQKAKTDLETAQATLAAHETDVNKFQADLGVWKAGAEKNFNKAVADREKAANTANAALARLRSLAAANGLNEEDVLKDIEVTPVPDKKVAPTFDTSGFITKENLQRSIAESALIDSSIHDVATRHFMLTGKPLLNARALVTEAIQKGKSIDEYAEEKFGFAKLQADKDAVDYAARVKADVDAGVTARLSELNLPGNIGPGREDIQSMRSPVLRPGGIPAPPAESGGGVSAAVAAFNAAKYKR